MFTDRVVTIVGFAFMIAGLVILGCQNAKIATILDHIEQTTAVLLKLH